MSLGTNEFDTEEEYDVVVDVLTKHMQSLKRMTDLNMQSGWVGMNIMDDIRLKQIGQINKCISLWKAHKSNSRGV